MKKIFKYTLALQQTQSVTMPKGAEILDIQVQNAGSLQLWAIVDLSAGAVDDTRVIKMHGTGHEVHDPIESLRYISTVQMGTFVWHFFEYVGG